MQTMLKVDDYLVLTGDASNVEDTGIYTRLANAARGLGARVVLDASGPYLAEGIRSKPYLVKPNEEELNHLAGRELNNEDEVIAFLLSTLFDGIAIIALTRGEKGAVLIKFGKELYTIPPVQVSVKNTVGCGDAFLAGLLAGIARGESPAETLSLAAAAGAAKAECPETVGFDPFRAQELRGTIQPVKLL